MANTYSKLYVHLVFGVKYRECLLDKSWRTDLYKYITGIIQKQNHLLIVVNGVEDHIHILIAMRPHQSLSDLVRDVKACSSKWINDKGVLPNSFHWQSLFGAFSYSPKDVPNVVRYIKNQEAHHSKDKFTDEYKRLLDGYEIDYDEKYLFKLEE